MEEYVIRASMKKELAELYGLTPREFGDLMKKHVKVVGEPCGRYYSTLQVALILKLVEKPACFLSDEFIPSQATDENKMNEAA